MITTYITPKTKWLLLVLIILVGTFFRLYHIQTIPPDAGFDPAYYGVDALRILNGEYPIYLATNYGREVMFSYLVAIAYKVVGPGVLGIHLASAFVAIATIPAVFLVTDELFKRDKSDLLHQFGGLSAAFILAVSFWHLAWSRYSVRAILIPLFISMLCFFLLRSFRVRHQRYFFLVGITMGLAFYTYQLAQLFPLLVGLGFLFDLITRRSFGKQDIVRLLSVFGVALLIASPLLIYIVNNPEVFNQRINDVFVLKDETDPSEQVNVLSRNIWQVIQMYTVKGDSDPLINIPGRPSLNPFLSGAFVVGVFIALWRWKNPRYLFLLIWFFLMSSPAFLADKAAMTKRALGALPAVTIFISLALLLPLGWLQHHQSRAGLHRSKLNVAYSIFIVAGLVFTGLTTYRDYFLRWGTNPLLEAHFNVGVAEIGKYIANLPETETIYLSPTWVEHSSLILHSNNREDIHAYNGRHCFVYPQETKADTVYIIVPSDETISLMALARTFPQGTTSQDGYLSSGNPYFTTFHIMAGTPAQSVIQFPVNAIWNEQIRFYGYDLETPEYHPGDVINIHLYYGGLADMGINYTVFLHLRGLVNPESGNDLWGQVDREPCFQSYPTTSWHVDEIMRDTFTLTIDPKAPSGEYQLTMGFYKWPELYRLNVNSTSHPVEGQTVLLQHIQITQ